MTSKGTFGDYASIDSGYAFKSSEWQSEGYPVVKIKNIVNGVIDLDDCAHISEDSAQRAKEFKAQGGDILISLTGYVGQVGRILPGDTAYVNQRVGFVRPNRSSDANYIFYLLQYLKPRIEELATGTAQANVSPIDITKLSVPSIPKESEQTIGEILANIDNKIALNKRLSENLESIAQSIFKSWFIDFDPVHAKSRGEKPFGMVDETAALFPDSFEESELGMIPKGWEVKSLDEINGYLNGLALQKFPAESFEESLPVIKIAQLKSGDTSKADRASSKINAKYIIEDGDILFSWSATLEVEHWTSGQGALNQHLFKVTGEKVPSWFAYFSTKASLETFRAIASEKATSMGHIQRRHLSDEKYAIPTEEFISNISETFDSLLNQKILLLTQCRSLTNLRDSLLRRLISGELQISEEILVS